MDHQYGEQLQIEHKTNYMKQTSKENLAEVGFEPKNKTN